MTPTITHYEHLGFTVEATPDDYSVRYRIFDVCGWQADDATGAYTVPIYECAGAMSSMDSVTDIALAAPLIEGYVKWDGCSNWRFHTEECMHHECGREGLMHIGQILAECWDMTATLCPNWDKELAR